MLIPDHAAPSSVSNPSLYSSCPRNMETNIPNPAAPAAAKAETMIATTTSPLSSKIKPTTGSCNSLTLERKNPEREITVGEKILQQKLTVGLDLGDRNSWYCVLDESGQLQLEQRVRTNAKALREVFGGMPHSRIALEIGTHSP